MTEPISNKATVLVRHAVRPWVARAESRILIGVSGGADSLALAYATCLEAKLAGVEVIAIIIDHQLQEQSNEVALRASNELARFGVERSEIVKVNVDMIDGMESSARRARYEAFESAIVKFRPDYFFLAHTKNDQAETVLLGLARGSGTRSLSGMAEVNGIYVRPLLGIDRSTTEKLCEENQIEYWQDPHNNDRSYARVRARLEVMPVLESNLGPGVVDALARTARILREDADALDLLAGSYLAEKGEEEALAVTELEKLPKAVRIRVLRALIYRAGAPEGSISADHAASVEAMVSDWHGQGAISLPGGVKVGRFSGRLSLSQS